MPYLKTTLSDVRWRKWVIAKAEIGNGKVITSEVAIEKLIDHYNRTKGRQLV